MSWEYAVVLVAVLAFPLVLSFDKKLRIRGNGRALGATLVIVSFPYWIWDLMAIARGHWSFHPDRILGAAMLGMPVEEWLFFPVLTFVSVFTWESTKYFLRGKG